MTHYAFRLLVSLSPAEILYPRYLEKAVCKNDRDIKPENLFLAGNGSLKLGDFGLAIRYFDERAVSRVGTLDYMSPEVHSPFLAMKDC